MKSNLLIFRLLMYSSCTLVIQILFCSFLLAAGPGSAQGLIKSVKDVKISATFDNQNILAVFEEIQDKTDFQFVYDSDDLGKGIIITASYSNKSVYDILLDISRSTNLSFKQVNQNLNVRWKEKTQKKDLEIEIDQEIIVKGKVRDENGEGMIGVTVQVRGTLIGTVTDIDGNYKVNVPDENAVLVYSFVGYKPSEIRVGNQSVINVDLELDVQALEEVVVIGYGTQTKRNLSSSVTSVDVEKINPATMNSFEGGLQGIAAGVQVTTSSALGGSAIRVRIRGTSSASANSEPLYVIDGIPVESGEISTSQPGSGISEWNLQQAANTNVLASLNPADIESIEILKDAAAAAIYGSRGANGVVLITTKNGKSGDTKISVDASFGLSTATNKIGLLNSEEYIALAKKAWFNSGNDIEDFWSESGVLVDGLTQEEAENTDTDWVDETLQIGKVQNYNISISGGNEKTTFFISANIKDQSTILRGNKYQRFGTRLNIDHQLSERFKVGGKMMLTHVDDEQVPTAWAGGVSNVSEMLPIWPVRKADGSYFNLTDEHPVAGVDLREINLSSNQIFGNWFFEADIVEGLSFRTELGTNLLFNNDFHFRDGRITDHGRTVSSTVSGQNVSWNLKNILNYKRTFGDHNFDFLAATDMQSFKSTTNFVFGDTFINTSLTRPQDAAIINASVSDTEYAFLSFISRVNYNFNEKYILSASMRADGSSRFGSDNRWGYFPAISGGWIISDENLFSPIKNMVNFLKLRASYGLVGNAEIGDFSHITTFNTTNYDGNTGVVIGNIGDDNLGWETTAQLNLGLTWEIFDGRISGEFDYYEKTTTDLLLPFPVSQMTGVSTITRNVGELSNKGFDVMLNTLNYADNDFSWETNFTLNYNKNEVVSLGDEQIEEGLSTTSGLSSTSIFPGHPVGVLEGVIWEGVDPATGEDTYLDSEGNTLSISQIIAEYKSFDNFVNEHREPIGNPWPKFTGGLDNRFTYKNFYANFLWTFATGQELLDGSLKPLRVPFGGDKKNPDRAILNAWDSPGDIASVSQLTIDNVLWPNTTEFLFRTDFLRLRNVTVGYRFNFNDSFINSLNVYTTLTNALTFTKAPDSFWDPEFTGVVQSRSANNIGAGSTFKQTPQAKTILFGVTVDF